MPTSKEYRQRADECVELMCEANEWYVNTALLELAEVFRIRAEKLERYEGTTMQYVVPLGRNRRPEGRPRERRVHCTEAPFCGAPDPTTRATLRARRFALTFS
jgi:hypothetical protein